MPLLNLRDTPERWQHHKDIIHQIRCATLHVKKINNPIVEGWDYPNCVAKFEVPFSLASKVPHVQKMLQFSLNVFETCATATKPNKIVDELIFFFTGNKQQTAINQGNPFNMIPPKGLHAQGARNMHPSKNMDRRCSKGKHYKKKEPIKETMKAKKTKKNSQ